MTDIKDHIETIEVNGKKIKIGISVINDQWYCSTLEGDTSVAGFEGGIWPSLEAYVKAMRDLYGKEEKHFIKSGEAAKHMLASKN